MCGTGEVTAPTNCCAPQYSPATGGSRLTCGSDSAEAEDTAEAATALEYDDLDVLLTGPAEYVVLKAEADAIPLVGVTRDNYKAWHLSVGCGFGPRLLRPKLRW